MTSRIVTGLGVFIFSLLLAAISAPDAATVTTFRTTGDNIAALFDGRTSDALTIIDATTRHLCRHSRHARMKPIALGAALLGGTAGHPGAPAARPEPGLVERITTQLSAFFSAPLGPIMAFLALVLVIVAVGSFSAPAATEY